MRATTRNRVERAERLCGRCAYMNPPGGSGRIFSNGNLRPRPPSPLKGLCQSGRSSDGGEGCEALL
jgi:hypothetical protein